VKKPTLTKKFLTLTVEKAAGDRIERMAEKRGMKGGEFVESLIRPLLETENAEELNWHLIALNGHDNAVLGKHCRKRKCEPGETLDVLIGDALERIDD
jgi:hypothetical protein